MKILTWALLIAVLMLGGCSQGDNTSETLKVLAGSELKDIEPKLRDIAKQTGVTLEMHYIGTLDGADKVNAATEHYDLAWFSHAKYLSLLQGQTKRIKAQEKIGLSPVIPAVKQSVARKLGWLDNKNLSWGDIAAAAAAGQFKYAMTDPTASNSGFSTVMGVQAAFAGSSDVITAKDVDVDKLKGFFSGQVLTSGSSGWLAEAYVRDQDRIDGLFNYESVLMSMNNSGQLREPLVLLYPAEGVVTADYPLILLDNDKRDAYQRLVEHMKTPEFQHWMMDNTDRRPVTPQVKPAAKFPNNLLIELPFPGDIQTVNEILFAYLDEHRRPSHSIFVLDVSGSMSGERLAALQQAILNLTGEDQSITGQFARFRKRERVTVIRFNNEVSDPTEFLIESTDPNSRGLTGIRDYVKGLQVGGGTAIYDALQAAYDLAAKAKSDDPDRFYSIVLMSDGASNKGSDYAAFERYYRNKSDYVPGVRTFPVLFGESTEQEMHAVAELTGGRVFDSRKSSLAAVFKKIRGYQ